MWACLYTAYMVAGCPQHLTGENTHVKTSDITSPLKRSVHRYVCIYVKQNYPQKLHRQSERRFIDYVSVRLNRLHNDQMLAS